MFAQGISAVLARRLPSSADNLVQIRPQSDHSQVHRAAKTDLSVLDDNMRHCRRHIHSGRSIRLDDIHVDRVFQKVRDGQTGLIH